MKAILKVFFLFSFLGLFWLVPSWAQQTPLTPSVDYRDVPWIGSRNVIWIIAQVHLVLGGFVLGVPIFAWICEIIGVLTKDQRYDRMAKEFTNLLTAAFEMTAMLGATFLFLLIALYPKLMGYLADIFLPTYYVYVLLFIGSTTTLYLYWSGFESMKGRKGVHLFLGFLLNVFALLIVVVPNSWATFQASPVVLPGGVGVWEKAWAAMWNPTWWPVNIHRLIANVVLGGYICGAYAGIKYLMAQNAEERMHYDWMGYVGNFIGVFGLLPLPFAGYWLMREIYQYNQAMGITLMGGFLSWLFILQAMLIGVLFLGANYYFWLGITYRIPGAEVKYKKPILAMLVVLLLCLGVWMTPHSLVASLEEARKMGGTHHPLLGVFGVMSAKMTVANLMILVTFMSFIMYWRAGKVETAAWAKLAKSVMNALLALAGVAVIVLGVWGYFVPAIVRINYFSTSQVLIVLFVLVTFTPLTAALLKSAKTTTEMVWGRMPARAGYVLVLNAVTVILLMTMMGYARSASRGHWHIYGVLEDTSSYAYSPALGEAGFFMALNTFVVLALVAFIFWIVSSRAVRHPAFSTQYFFLAPFLFWAVSLFDKPAGSAPRVSEGPKYFRRAVATAFGLLIAFTYIANQVPQTISLPPKKVEFDPLQIKTQADLAKVGQGIFFGKGQCALCHSIGPSESARCPDLKGIGAKLTREFIYESLTQPQAYIYQDYRHEGVPKEYPARMPVINKNPIGLTNNEIFSVIAFLQQMSGEPISVHPSEITQPAQTAAAVPIAHAP
ncbi:MAG: c-type cytochrome [Nitrospira sp.]|nr:MAG: c-type cytochrome [Nitrospira sp.]